MNLKQEIKERLVEKGIISTGLGCLCIFVAILMALFKYDVFTYSTVASIGLLLLGVKDKIIGIK